MFRLDRSAFQIRSFKNATDHRQYWLSKTPAERWAAAWYLTACAWNIDYKNPPALDRTCFTMRKNG